MSEREPGWYWTKLWPTAQWQPALYRFEAGVIGPHPEGFWMAHAMQGVLLDNSLAEIGPRILPPGSDPSPAPCLDAKEMMRDVFTSWLKHRAAILTSPAEPAHTTQLLQDDIEKVLLERLFDKRLVGYTLETAKELAGIANAFAASAVEQERQRLLPAEPREDLILTIATAICGQRWSHLNAGEEEREKGRARALYEAIRSRSAEPPSPGQKIIEGLTEALAHTKGEVSARYQCGHWHRNPEEARACVAEPPNAKGGE